MKEGHRKTSGKAMTFDMRKRDDSELRLLFIGSPAQDEPAVLRTILHFHDPLEFSDAEVSARESSQNGSQCGRDHKEAKVAMGQFSKLREQLSFRMLRRMKLEVRGDLISGTNNVKVVPCAMTDMQRQFSIDILKKHRMSLTLPVEGLRSSLPNVLLELKMVCNHPSLFPGKTPKLPDAREDYEVLIASSGKLQFLQKILPPLKEQGHNVLLLSQTKVMLEILSRFLTYLGLQHCMINESDSDSVRQRHIDAYKSEHNGLFVALVSTEFGDQRINLPCADTIIICDPDYRSLVEIVARERAQSLAQQKPMLVYCLVTKDSVEEKILRGSRKKLAFEDLVMSPSTRENSADIKRLLLHAASVVFEREDCDRAETSVAFSDKALKNLLDRSTSQSDGEHPHRHTTMTSPPVKTSVGKRPDSQETVQNGGIDFSTSETKGNLHGVRNGCIMAPQAPQRESDFVDASRLTTDVTLPPMCQSPLIAASSGERSDHFSGVASTDLSIDAGSADGRNSMSGTKPGNCVLSVSDFTGLDLEVDTAGEAPFSPQAVVCRKSSSLSAAKIVHKPPVIPGFSIDDCNLEESCDIQRRESSAACPPVRIDTVNASSGPPGSSVDRTASRGSHPPKQKAISTDDGLTKAPSVDTASVILGLSDHHTGSGVSRSLKRKASSATAAKNRARECANACLACHDPAKLSSTHLCPKKRNSRKGHSKGSSLKLPHSRAEKRENAMDGHESVADHESITELRTNSKIYGRESSNDQSESGQATEEQVRQVVAGSSLQERSSKASADMLLKSSRARKPFWLPKGDARLLMCHPKEPGRTHFTSL